MATFASTEFTLYPMDVLENLRTRIDQALQQIYGRAPGVDVVVQPTRKEFPGDYTVVLFSLAKKYGVSLQDLGDALSKYLVQEGIVAESGLVQGFLNLTLEDAVLWDAVGSIPSLDQGITPQTIVLEYASPNTNKPLHLGHLRNIFLGDALARIYAVLGHRVSKVCLVNDRGIHICKSMVAYMQKAQGATPETTQTKGDHLVGDYYVAFERIYQKEVAELAAHMPLEEAKAQAPIMLQAQELLRLWEAGDTQVHALWQRMNDWVYAGFAQTYQRLGINFDRMYYESSTYLLGKDLVQEGLDKGCFYRKEDGSVWAALSQDGQEKLLLRADQTAVYITQDLGTAELRYQDYAFDKSLYVIGSEQDHHFIVLRKLLEKLGRSYSQGMEHVSYGMVHLPSGRMKSREGTVVDADQLLDALFVVAQKHTQVLGKAHDESPEDIDALNHTISLGALKYFLLRVDAQKNLLFEPDASIDLHGDTGPFIQYTHARACSILRRAQHIPALSAWSGYRLHVVERDLVIGLGRIKDVVQEAARERAPALVAGYALALAKAYNRMYAELSILQAQEEQERALRLALTRQVVDTLQLAMGLLGIALPKRM